MAFTRNGIFRHGREKNWMKSDVMRQPRVRVYYSMYVEGRSMLNSASKARFRIFYSTFLKGWWKIQMCVNNLISHFMFGVNFRRRAEFEMSSPHLKCDLHFESVVNEFHYGEVKNDAGLWHAWNSVWIDNSGLRAIFIFSKIFNFPMGILYDSEEIRRLRSSVELIYYESAFFI